MFSWRKTFVSLLAKLFLSVRLVKTIAVEIEHSWLTYYDSHTIGGKLGKYNLKFKIVSQSCGHPRNPIYYFTKQSTWLYLKSQNKFIGNLGNLRKLQSCNSLWSYSKAQINTQESFAIKEIFRFNGIALSDILSNIAWCI